MSKFNFNSQVCTDRFQSERLLALGLKKETADMTWEFSHTKNGDPQYDCRAESSWDSETFARYVEHCEKIGYFEHWKHEDGSQMTPEEVYDEIMKNHIPAWSLHRLLELCVCDIEINIFLSRRCFWLNKPYNEPKRADKEGGIYDGVIDYIEWLIKEGYFNKEYLV